MDFLVNKVLNQEIFEIFDALYPYNENKHQIKFMDVQTQIECECGILAIAFAISIIHQMNPAKVTYLNRHVVHKFHNSNIESTTMRIFLHKMILENQLRHFSFEFKNYSNIRSLEGFFTIHDNNWLTATVINQFNNILKNYSFYKPEDPGKLQTLDRITQIFPKEKHI